MSVLTRTDPPVDPDVAYPATGTVPESTRHSRARTSAFVALDAHFSGRRDCFVGEDLDLYYRPLPDPRWVGPDVLVSFGVDPEPVAAAASYRLWDVGAPPSFVLEVASASTYERDRDEKPSIYLEVGVKEYWRFDPSRLGLLDPVLQGDRRRGGRWEPIEVAADGYGRLRGRSEALGLDIFAEENRLRFKDPQTDLWLPDHNDTRRERDAEAAARRAAQARATAAEDRAAAAEDRANAAEAKVAELRARLADRDGDAGADPPSA